MSVAAVVIGRNEGARLIVCLEALAGQVDEVIYVDSGSSDGSLKAAMELGAKVIALDMSRPFTAARARNEGIKSVPQNFDYIHFLDGDCAVRSGWIAGAVSFLDAHPKVAVACGRRRERFPEASVYNSLIDAEWDTPLGEAKACGGDALMRADALRAVGGYRDSLIAGEEPELCVRLRARGWKIWRLDAEMTWHDAAITRFGQWWQRARRAGHAFAEGAHLHGAPPERHWVTEARRSVLWGAALPAMILLAALLVTPWALALLMIYPAQVLRLSARSGRAGAFFSVLGKFPEAIGAVQFHISRLSGRNRRLIEYK